MQDGQHLERRGQFQRREELPGADSIRP
jgi:hypothetical protein